MNNLITLFEINTIPQEPQSGLEVLCSQFLLLMNVPTWREQQVLKRRLQTGKQIL